MPKYEFTSQQVENMKVLILDANIKGSVAPVIVGLLKVLNNPLVENEENDLHSEHKSVTSSVRDKR